MGDVINNEKKNREETQEGILEMIKIMNDRMKNDLNNEYKILEKIGSGSFGKIYSVIWEKNNRKYAMKIMKLKK